MRKISLPLLLLFSLIVQADDYYFAVKGGVSLGSYEAGYNWLLIDTLKKQANENSEGGDRLKVMSGASAGSINTILSVLEYCNADSMTSQDAFLNNRFREGWDVDIEELLPARKKRDDGVHKHKSGNGERLKRALRRADGDEGAVYFKDRGSLLSRAPFMEKISRIEEDVLNGRFVSHCNGLSITISVTRFVPEQITLGKGEEPIQISRFVIPLKVEVHNGNLYFKNDYQIKRENSKAVASKQGIPIFHHIYLPEGNEGRVAIFQLIKAALASSAFPVAFSPVELSYCNSEEACTRGEFQKTFFSDGGLFDNAPIGAASEQLLQQADLDPTLDSDKVMVVYIDPANRRSDEVKATELSSAQTERFGLAAYFKYFAGAMNVGMNQELYRAKVRLMSKKIKLHTSSRRHPLAGNFHMHFSAFYSEDFRVHDYLVGLYDAAHDLARTRCSRLRMETHACTRGQLRELLDSAIQIDDNASELVNNGANFVGYLFADEFGECLDQNSSQPCRWIEPANTEQAVVDNPYQMISLSLRKYHHKPSDPVRVVEEELIFTKFIERLSAYNQRSGGKLSKSTEAIVSSSNTWLAKRGDILFKRLLANQELAADENYGLDQTVDTILSASEPTVDTILAQQQVGYWPLSPLPFTKLDGSLYYGFDIGEYAQVFTFRGVRIPFMQKLSLEFPLTYHRMSKARESDHYFSGGPAIMYHFDNYGLSSLELGYEISGKGKLYFDESTRALSLSVGLLGEGIRIQFQHRDEPVNSSYSSTEIRTRNQIMFKFDLLKSVQTAINLL